MPLGPWPLHPARARVAVADFFAPFIEYAGRVSFATRNIYRIPALRYLRNHVCYTNLAEIGFSLSHLAKAQLHYFIIFFNFSLFSVMIFSFTPLLRKLPLVGILAGLLLLGAAPAAKAQTWMVSTTAQIKLGVLDKYGQLGPYTATFIVHSERTGKDYYLVKELAKGQTGVDVLFPTEASDPEYFKAETGEAAQPTPGRYTWECRVKGVKAVGGRFTFPEVANDVSVVQR